MQQQQQGHEIWETMIWRSNTIPITKQQNLTKEKNKGNQENNHKIKEEKGKKNTDLMQRRK